MIIEKITLSKKEYEILFSDGNQLKILEDTLVKFNLYKGMEVADNFIEILSHENQKIHAFNLASRYLSHPKLSKQVKDFLSQKKLPSHIIEDTILALTEKGYLNDVDYGMKYLKDAQKIKKYGRKKINYMLFHKGVSSKDLDEIFKCYDNTLEYSNCKELALQKYQTLNHKDETDKIIRFLIGRGYSYNLINKVLQEIS